MRTISIALSTFVLSYAYAQSATDEAAFSSAASQLISLYIPASAASAIISVASRHHIHGTPAAVLESAFTATATPSWLTRAAALSAYQPNIQNLDSAISALRGAASVGSISGAARVVMSTDAEGSTVTTTSPGVGASSAGVTLAPGSGGESRGVSSGAATSDTSSSTLSTGAGSTLMTSTSSESLQSSATLIATGAISSSSSGLAAATQVPCLAAGVLGLAGALIAL